MALFGRPLSLDMCTGSVAEDQALREVLYKLARATTEYIFDEGHTVDITAWVSSEATIKGLLLTKLIAFEFSERTFGGLLCAGLTCAELDYALEHGSDQILQRLKSVNIFPVTKLNRLSVI